MAALHLVLSRRSPGVVLWSDGASYLAHARFLAPGTDAPYLDVTPFYNVGYGVLLAPVLLVASSAEGVFRGVLTVNALLAGAGAIVLYRLAVSAFELGRWPAAAAAGLAAAYPPVLLQSRFEWTEALVFTLVAAWALAVWRLVERGGERNAVAIGAVSAALYAVHPRTLGLVAVAAILLVALGVVRRVRPTVTLSGIASLLICSGVTAALHAATRAAMWADAAPGPGEGLVRRLLTPALWDEIALRVAGQTWYLLVATAGLAAAGLVGLGGWAVAGARRERCAPQAWFGLAVLAGFAASLVIAVAGRVNPERVDHHVYGRYIEMLAPVLLVAAVAWIWRAAAGPSAARLRFSAVLAASTAVAGGLVAILYAGYGRDAFSGGIAPLNVLGVLVWTGGHADGAIDLVRVTVTVAGAVVVLAALLVLAGRHPWVPALAVTAAFVLGAAATGGRTLDPFVDRFRAVVTLDEVVDTVTGGEPAVLAYDLAARDSMLTNAYQVELPEHRFAFFDSRRGEQPASDLVIASKSWGAGHPAAALVYPEPGRDQALWVLPGPLHDGLRRRHLLAEGLDRQLPESFYRAELQLVDPSAVRLPAGESVTRTVTVHHPVSVPPLLRFEDSLATGAGAGGVRLGVRWYVGTAADAANPVVTQLAALPRTVPPGQSATGRLTLRAVDGAGEPLPTGTYTIVIALLHEGVGWFDDLGGAAGTVRVTVTVPP